MSRANSLKKAVRQIIEHTERVLDEQNAQIAAMHTTIVVPPEIRLHASADDESSAAAASAAGIKVNMVN